MYLLIFVSVPFTYPSDRNIILSVPFTSTATTDENHENMRPKKIGFCALRNEKHQTYGFLPLEATSHEPLPLEAKKKLKLLRSKINI